MNDFTSEQFNKLIKDISIKIKFADDEELIFHVDNNKTFYSPKDGIKADKPGVNLEFSHPIGNDKPVENVSKPNRLSINGYQLSNNSITLYVYDRETKKVHQVEISEELFENFKYIFKNLK